MPRKSSYITVTDQFCGAGGSSQGVRRVSERYRGGLEVKLALNHWKLAIETHNTNFPDTLHDCTDISACDPRRYPSTDILITSPECTNHSLAKGTKVAKKQMDLFETGKMDPAAERSRATMWDVPRFAEYHNYRCIIVENVVDARKWVMFDSWLHAMHSLGYLHRCVYLNSMHCHPTPQSRDRMYVVFWKKGNKAPMLDYSPAAYCGRCSRDVEAVQTWKRHNVQYGKYRQQYVYCCPSCTSVVEPYYYAAFNCIDWSDLGTRIGDRAKPLSPKTIKRIEYGLKKYGSQPMQIVNYTPGYARTISDTTGTMTTNDHHGLLTPYLIHAMYGEEARGVWRSVKEPTFAHTTVPSQALVTPPLIVNDQHTTGVDFRVRSGAEALNTIPSTHGMKLVCPPFIIKLEHGHGDAAGKVRSSEEALQTQTTRQSSMLVHNVRPSAEALQTQTTCQGMGVCVPPMIVMARGQSLSRSSLEAMSTQTSMINHGILTPFLTDLHSNGAARPASEPVSTITAGGVKNGIVVNESWNSFFTNYYGKSLTTKTTDALGAVTTTDRNGLVSYPEPTIEECYYRMLKPVEIKLAMAFDREYVVLGSGRDQVKQLGNAVTPPAMEWLVERCIESLS